MLVADPAAVDDLGLQLSALATAGLVLWQGSIAERLALLPGPVREGIATTVAATAPTLPVVAGAFGRVSLVSPLANLVCVPLFPLLMLAGAATSLAGAVWLDAARPIALVAWAAAFALRLGVQSFAALPFASLAVPDGPVTGACVAILEVAAVVAARRIGARIRISGSIASRSRRSAASRTSRTGPLLARLVVSARSPGPFPRAASALVLVLATLPVALAAGWPAPTGVRVIALDVGQGDAYFVDVGGTTMLVDGGPDPARILDELGATLAPWQRRIDVVALTHAHADHGAGLLAVLERYDVGLAIEPEGLNSSPLTDLWSAAIARRGVRRRAMHAGERLELGDATVSVLAPDADVRVDVPSLVLRVSRGPLSVLFTGDAVDDALAHLLDHAERLRSRIYIPPHHGAETPYGGAMRAAARPEAALISVGAGNRYGHPTAATLSALSGVPTYRTDQDGTVEIGLDGTGLVVRTHANALPPPRRGPLPLAPARQ
jgi:competence protein ComEC